MAYASVLPFAAIALSAQQAASSTPPAAAVVAAVTAPHLPAILTSAGVLIVCCAAAALLLAGIPLLWSLARAANRMESMMQTLEMELPDTAASIRLSSLELSDCVSELGALGSDVSSGIQATARMVTTAEAGLKQGAGLVTSAVVPALAKRETRVRDVLEAALQARAALAPQLPKARAAVAATTATARKLRGAVMLTKLAAGVFDIGRAVRMQLTVAAAEQILQQDSAANRAAAQISKAVKQKDAHTMDVQRTGSKGRKQQPSTGTA